MLLWVNLHGGFFIGIITLAIYTVTEGIRLKKMPNFHLILCVLCLLLSVCNPYGVQIWKEVLLTSTDLMVRASISEWMPAFFYINIPFWIYTGFIIALAIRYRNIKENLFYLVLGTFLLINVFVGMRHIPLWLLTTFYMWGQYYPQLKQDSARNKTIRARFDKVKKIATYTIAAAFFIQSVFYIQSIISSIETKMYPVGALKYLTTQKKDGNMFALYGWGGYIVWKIPGEKTFIDGRMPIWNGGNKNTRFLSYAYADYLNILGGRAPFEYYRAKYHITYVLMPTKKRGETGKNIFTSYPVKYSDETATLYDTK